MTDLPAELATWPAWTLSDEQLGELELLISGAFAPLTGYLSAADLAAVSARGQLADGTPWPVPVTLTLPAGAVPEGHRDAEGRAGTWVAVGCPEGAGVADRVHAPDRLAPAVYQLAMDVCLGPALGADTARLDLDGIVGWRVDRAHGGVRRDRRVSEIPVVDRRAAAEILVDPVRAHLVPAPYGRDQLPARQA